MFQSSWLHYVSLALYGLLKLFTCLPRGAPHVLPVFSGTTFIIGIPSDIKLTKGLVKKVLSKSHPSLPLEVFYCF